MSSRSIARRHVEPLSPATVRNVMADLEDQGYLYQPHTSAGRVPTAAGVPLFCRASGGASYRQRRRPAMDSARTRIGADARSVMERASHVLAEVSRGWGFLFRRRWPAAWWSTCAFCLLPDGRVLIVLITTGGLTRDKLIRPERAFRQDDLDRIATLSERPLHGLDARGHARRSCGPSWNAIANGIAGSPDDALMLCDPAALDDERRPQDLRRRRRSDRRGA